MKVLGLGVPRQRRRERERDRFGVHGARVVTGGGESVQADLYSVGVLLFHMVSARVPMRARRRPRAVARRHEPDHSAAAVRRRGLPDREQTERAPADAEVRARGARRRARGDARDRGRGPDPRLPREPESFTERARQEAISSLLRVARDLNDGPPPDPQAAPRGRARCSRSIPATKRRRRSFPDLDGDSSDRTMMMPAGGMPSLPPRDAAAAAAAAAPPRPPAAAPKPEVKPAAPAPPKSEVKPAAAKPEISRGEAVVLGAEVRVKPAAAPASRSRPRRARRRPRSRRRSRSPPSARAPRSRSGEQEHGLLVGIGVVVVALIVALRVRAREEEAGRGGRDRRAGADGDRDARRVHGAVGAVVTVEAGGSSQTNTSNTTFRTISPSGTARACVWSWQGSSRARDDARGDRQVGAVAAHGAAARRRRAGASVYVAVTPKAEGADQRQARVRQGRCSGPCAGQRQYKGRGERDRSRPRCRRAARRPAR